MDRFTEMTDRIVDRVLACDNAAVTQMLRDLWDTAHEQGRTQKKEQNRAQRLQVVNELLGEIANRGRRFFWHRGNVSRFVWDQDKLWYVDGGNGRKLALHGRPTWNGFTEGFTLATLVAGLRDFIKTGQPLPSATFGPWPEYIAGGGTCGATGKRWSPFAKKPTIWGSLSPRWNWNRPKFFLSAFITIRIPGKE